MIYRIHGIRLLLDAQGGNLKEIVAGLLGVEQGRIEGCRMVRRSIDARRNRPPAEVCVVDAETKEILLLPGDYPPGITVEEAPAEPDPLPSIVSRRPGRRPVIVGCGPAGLFAALTFIRCGVPVLLLERGKAVEDRAADVAAFWRHGRLDPESHVQFGEGGAGTFSDGKLTSRTKNPYAGWVKKVLVEMGAPEPILTDAKPHIGTDRLRQVLVNLRRHLIEGGGEVRFGAKMTDILIAGGKVAGVVVGGEEEIEADCLVMAIGQSADDSYGLLHERGVCLEAKPFAAGLRVEHPQALINAIQYGKWASDPRLPPAEYFLTAAANESGRSVYTFCMCPGGRVIGSSSAAGGIVTNGMSNALRNGSFANSAVVVSVQPEDFLDATGSPLSGLAFRRRWEEAAFHLGGGDYRAPAERLLDFLSDKTSPDVGKTTFLPGVYAASVGQALPEFIGTALREGFGIFNRKMPGFVSEEANLIGVETRTSSPVRIVREPDGQSVSTLGLYPCGEGAGYAGGIISSALDGIRAAERALATLS